ncbi:MAG: ATP-binding protein [bacterium]|nr:ATP-binding protein [bacterium]
MELTLDLLSIQNPWWRGESLKFDPVVERYERQSLKWRPGVLAEINLKKDKIYFLAGLKGVGKTTVMKLLIKQLLEEEKIRPANLFFYSCHNLDSYEQLNEMIKLFLNWSGAGRGRRYILIDEIAMVKKWRPGLDFLIKAGVLKNVTVVLSGSSWNGARDDAYLELKLMSGLSFSEFMGLINPAIFLKINKNNFLNHRAKLDYYLDIYLLTGGFISAINDFKANGAVGQSVYSNFLHWFLAYVARSGRDTVLVRQILEKIILNLGRPVGFKTLAQKTKAKTHLTAAEYLKILEAMFAVKTVYQADGSRQAKKIYFTDPFIFWLFYSYAHGSLDYWRFSRERLHDHLVFNALAENLILSQLAKDGTNKIFYWRDNIRKQEINFMVEGRKKTTPILIRYNQDIKQADFEIFKSAGFKKGIIISRDVMAERAGIKIMPLTYFLLFF